MAKQTVKFPKKIVDHYIQKLNEKINVRAVLLFGSFAWGKPTKHSDVDLVIISPDFSKKEFRNRLQWLSRMRDEITYQIAMDIIGYTPKEFAEIEKQSAIMRKAKKEGKWLYRYQEEGKTKQYTLKDLKKIQFRSKDKDLSKKIDKIVYK